MAGIARSFNRSVESADGIPKVKLKIAGRASSTASNWVGNGAGEYEGSVGAGSSSDSWISSISESMGRVSGTVFIS
jgi:hypothetical protein